MYPEVPRLMSAGTVAVLGSGPSLCRADVEACRVLEGVICVNDTYKLAPWALALYAADEKWWTWHSGAPAFAGRYRYTLAGEVARKWKGVVALRRGSETGLSSDRTRVALGRNGVYQAINVAVHFGASRILLLGVDMSLGPRADGKGKSDHFFGHHPDNTKPEFAECLRRFETLVRPLRDAGVEILNCSRRTALTAFPCVPLEEALARREAVA